MTKHHPGPWTIAMGTGQPKIIALDDSGYNVTICILPPEPAVSPYDLGNARLLAAAPDLLKALIDIQRYLYSFGELNSSVNQAITKATGKF